MEMEVPQGLELAAPPHGTLPAGQEEMEEEEQLEDDSWADTAPVVSRPPAEREREASRSPRGHTGSAAADAPGLPSHLASFHKIDLTDAALFMHVSPPAGHRGVATSAVLHGLPTRIDLQGKGATIVAWSYQSNAYLCKVEDDLWMVPPQCLR